MKKRERTNQTERGFIQNENKSDTKMLPEQSHWHVKNDNIINEYSLRFRILVLHNNQRYATVLRAPFTHWSVHKHIHIHTIDCKCYFQMAYVHDKRAASAHIYILTSLMLLLLYPLPFLHHQHHLHIIPCLFLSFFRPICLFHYSLDVYECRFFSRHQNRWSEKENETTKPSQNDRKTEMTEINWSKRWSKFSVRHI